MNPKNIYFSKYTQTMVESVFPDHYEIVKNKYSNAYRYVNLLYGIEFDYAYTYLDEARHNNTIEFYDYGTDFDYHEVTLRDGVVGDYVYGDNIPVKITNNSEFNDGEPTRLKYQERMTISGVKYGALGIEYMRTDSDGSGMLLVNTDVDTGTVFGSGYQTWKVDVDPLGNFDLNPISGYNFLVRTKDYNSTRRDELLTPPFEYQLKKEYPETRKIWAPSGTSDFFYEYEIDHYTPNNGYVWNDVTKSYDAVGYNTEFYYDAGGFKTFYRTYLNNPFGTGIYNTVHIPLEYIPISGTMRLYDLDILTSGELTEIPQTGIWLYRHSGMYDIAGEEQDQLALYIGYQSGVPHEYLPENMDASGVAEAYADRYKYISWNYLHDGAGVNDNLDWEDDSTQPITNMITINNPHSRYIVEYKYKIGKKVGYLTTIDATKYIKYDNGSYTFTSTDNEDNAQKLEHTLSIDPGERTAICFNGLDVRPGSIVEEIKLKLSITKELSSDLQLSSMVIDTRGPKLGNEYETVKPNKKDHRTYLFNQYWADSDLSNVVDLYSTGVDIIDEVVYGNTLGVSIFKRDGGTYYETKDSYSGYIDLETQNESTSNRYVKIGYRLNQPIQEQGDQIFAFSCNESGQYWKLYLSQEGRFFIETQNDISSTYYTIFDEDDTFERELILERNMQYNYAFDDKPFNLYTRVADTKNRIVDDDLRPFTKMDMSHDIKDNPLSSGEIYDFTKFFIDSSIDIKYVQIYEEQEEYVNGQ